MRTQRGFTLWEVVITMVMVAILMALAIPSYRYVTNKNRIAAEVNGLLGDMQFARAEAIKEGQWITVCVANGAGTGCAGAATSTWQNGWLIFIDVNGNGQFNAGDTILRQQAAFTSTDTFVSTPATGYVMFNREGFAAGGTTAAGVEIKLHALTANSASTRCLSITYAGLMTVQLYNQTNNTLTCN
jgi:type IV fimbrial biogenesis protein FimT